MTWRACAAHFAAFCALLFSRQAESQLPAAAKPIRAIGTAHGSVEEAFSFIGDVEVSRAGGVFVLDRFARHIAWFDAEGRFVQRIGREGRGPGEFQTPYAMAVDDSDRLHVYDSSNRRVSVYAISDRTATHLADHQLEVRARDICTLRGRRFLLTPHEPMVVQELRSDGTVLRSLVPREEPEPDVVRKVADHLGTARAYYNAALLACDVQSETIALAHENVPIVRLFGIDGRQRWRTVLQDFHGRILGVTERGGFSFRTDPKRDASHSASALAFVAGRLVVTLWEGGASNPEGRLEARVIELSSGREVDRQMPPARLTKVLGNRSYAFVQHPYPAVLLYAR